MIWSAETILILIVATVASSLVGYFLAKSQLDRLIGELNAQLQQERQHIETQKSELGDLRTQLTVAREKLEEVKAQNSKQETEIQVRDTKLETSAEREQELRGEIADLKADLASKIEQVESARSHGKALQAKLDELQNNIETLKEINKQLEDKYEAKLSEYQTLNQSYTQLKTELQERQASHAREVENFEQQKKSLEEHFKVLSNEILQAQSKSLQESSKLTLNSVIDPFKQSMDSFKKEVQEIHHRETSQQAALRKELEQLKELNQRITQEAHELSTALRGQKKLQGNWGELILENVLDRSGLQLGKDYEREISIKTEDGRKRPDAIVYLPQNKHLVIDAKVSLNAYTRYVNAEDENERSLALQEHVYAVASRIKELADKDYYRLPGLNSPEIVFMFIPIESAFVEALKGDETIFQSALENNVLVATPTTLLTSLNIVRQLWRYEEQNKHTAALASKAESVFKCSPSDLVGQIKVLA